jgi:isopentenyl-diphosphate Delta-isomerase
MKGLYINKTKIHQFSIFTTFKHKSCFFLRKHSIIQPKPSKKIHFMQDPTAVSRKRDHIDLAFRSQIGATDSRFYYEPLFSAHPDSNTLKPFVFLNKTFKVPMWVSSMTGGTAKAHIINRNLARAARDFGFGMGLGSCRQLLYDPEHLADFDVRELLGYDLPLFANLGIAQLERLIDRHELHLVIRLIDMLEADGLIIHVNPMQEWLQPEGDRFKKPPIETIETIAEKIDCQLIVKEVGQGFGYHSLKKLFQLPLAAVDFAASGGTNFAQLELLRSSKEQKDLYEKLAFLGHTAEEMVHFTNQIKLELGDGMRCSQVIISGGIRHFLDGFYLMKKLNMPSVYGQAAGFLQHAQGNYDDLFKYVESQVNGLALAEAYLRVR